MAQHLPNEEAGMNISILGLAVATLRRFEVLPSVFWHATINLYVYPAIYSCLETQLEEEDAN